MRDPQQRWGELHPLHQLAGLTVCRKGIGHGNRLRMKGICCDYFCPSPWPGMGNHNNLTDRGFFHRRPFTTMGFPVYNEKTSAE
jgi:hypothetical protein